MAIRFNCPVCGYRIKAPDGSFNRRGQCPRCRLMVRIPSQEELARRLKGSETTPGQGGPDRPGHEQPAVQTPDDTSSPPIVISDEEDQPR